MNQGSPLDRESGLPREGKGSGKFPGGPSEMSVSTRAPADGWTKPVGAQPSVATWSGRSAAPGSPQSRRGGVAIPADGCVPVPRLGRRDRIQPGRGSGGGLLGGKGRGRPRVSQAQGLKSPVGEPALMLQNPGAPSRARGGPGTRQKLRVKENSARHPVKPILSRPGGRAAGGGG